jgi:DNA polymerase-3 subunit delta
VVIIDDADKFVTDNREKLEDYFDNPSPTSVLILVCDSWRKATKLDKKLVNVGELISVEKFKYPWQAVDCVVKRAVEVGLDVLKPVANRLVSVVGVDTGRLGNELEKISIYAGSRKKITEEDVDELCGVTAEESIFELTDKLMERNISGALEILTRILESDRSAEYTLTGAIGFSLRKLLKIKLLIESGTAPYDACKAANIHQPFVIEKTTRLLKNISAKKIQRMLSELLKVDYDNKTGLGKPKMNMEKFVVTANLAG